MGPGLIGRESELARIRRFLDRIDEGFAALVLKGDAGIGKTTVWLDGVRQARDQGALVLSCRPAQTEASFSFAAVRDLLAPVGDADLSALPGPQREALDIALLRSSGRTSWGATAAGFLSLLGALAAAQPVVLAVDDWQWLDTTSRRVLEFAVRRLEPERVGLLCSARTGGTMPPVGEHLVIGQLSLAALGRIIAQRLGTSLPRPLLAQITEASWGNPFYALEIAHLWVVQRPRPGALPVPDDLRKLTASRIRRLPSQARESVLLAAVISNPDGQSVDLDALAPAEAAGIVTIDGAGRVEFTHPLLASAAYGSETTARRRELHRMASERMADPEQRARHLALGSAGPDASVAAELDAAATLATARGAPDAAAELCEHAAGLTPAGDSEALGQRQLAAAQFWLDAGDLARSEDMLEGLESAPAVQLKGQLAARRNNFTDAAALATRALAIAGSDRRLRAAIELDLVYCAVSLGDIPGAAPHAETAVSHARAAGEDGMLADALAVLTMAEFLAGQGLNRDRLNTALELEDPWGASAFIMRPRTILGMLQLWCGELEAGLESLSQVYTEALERGQEGLAPFLPLYIAWAQVWRGELRAAARLAEQAVESAPLLEDPTISGIALTASAIVHAHDGRTDLARAEASEALALFERVRWRSGVIWPLWAIGVAALSDGEPAEADAALRPLAELLSSMGAGDPAMAMFLPDELEALIALGELDRAQAFLEPFAESAARLDRAWALAAAERCRGALAGARGDPQGAFAAFDRALRAHDRAGMPFERARTLLVAGRVYRRFKQRGRARELLEEAVAEFKRVGAPAWAQRAQVERERIGRLAAGGAELTETERQLAELAASGLSNQEVAERAFVSVKTVEANLTRVYRKLGVRSRVGLANALRGELQA